MRTPIVFFVPLLLAIASTTPAIADRARNCKRFLDAHDTLKVDVLTGRVSAPSPQRLSAGTSGEKIVAARAVESAAAAPGEHRFQWALPGVIDPQTNRYLMKGNPTILQGNVVAGRVKSVRSLSTDPRVSVGSYQDLAQSLAYRIEGWTLPPQQVSLPISLETAQENPAYKYGELEFVYDDRDQLTTIRHRALVQVEDPRLYADSVDAERRSLRLMSVLMIHDQDQSALMEL